jgi:SAM-dependent methyltransferase
MPEALAESPPLPERIEPESAGEPAREARSAVLPVRDPKHGRVPAPTSERAPERAPAARPMPIDPSAPEATPASPGPGLLRRLAERRSPRRVKVSTALRFYHEVLGLDHLHYGLWNGEAFDLAGLKKAQDRFSRLLCQWVPADAGSVLDVGCGIGSTARMLHEGGLDVEGLSPDPYHRDAFARRVGTPFHLARFQEFEPERRYDLVLMSESAQYIWLDRLFPSVSRAAVPGGHLLVADYFTVNGAEGVMARSGHPLADFLEEAERAGLELERREDVTDRVAPTLDLARSWLSAYVEPCLSIASESFRGRHPHLARIGRWLLRGRIERLRELEALVDSERFKEHKRYLVLLFRVPRAL